MNNNPRPLSRRETIRLLVIVLVMVMVAQMFMHRRAFGQSVNVAMAASDALAADALSNVPQASQKFMPSPAAVAAGTLELRSEATIVGTEVKLRAVCRWSSADAAAFEPLGDLTLLRLSSSHPYRSITVEEIRQMLRDAGVNVAMINFAGSETCAVSTSAVNMDSRAALEQWLASRDPSLSRPAASDATTAAPPTEPRPAGTSIASSAGTESSRSSATLAAALPSADRPALHTLGQLLEQDCATRLGIPLDSLQITFNPADEKIINLVEPQFRFSIDAVRVRDLGNVEWQVVIVAGDAQKTVDITATARQWQNQLIVARSISARQVIRDSDIIEHRTLVDHLPDDPLLTKPQSVGQEAARDLKPGTILTARLVDPVPLCKSDDLITVTVRRGNVELKTVARAMEAGGYGQTVRVRDQQTSDTYDVVLTGPQEGRVGAVPEVSAAAASASARLP
jgi:flagella basal body P-ring formation protein FlgA